MYTQNIQKMREYFNQGATLDYKFRKEQLDKLLNALKKYEQPLLDALNSDLGKRDAEAYMMETYTVYSELRHARKNLKRWMRAKRVPTPLMYLPSSGKLLSEPLGIALIMSPWNYPLQLTINPLIASIAAGNCTVVKPSRYAPATSAVMKQLLQETFPPEYVSVFEGGSAVNNALLEQKFDFIFFTGSPTVGRVVMDAASKNLTPVILELGGKNPAIIDKTANLKIAARRIIWGKSVNSGQTCVEPDYLLVHSDVKKEFIAQMQAAVKQFYGDSPIDNPDFARIVSERHFDRLLGLMKDGNVLFGGRTDREKLKIEPTAFDGLSLDSPIMGMEIFGPLIPVFEYSDISEAYKIISSFAKPLAFYIYSKDKALIKDALQKVPFGGGCVNDVMLHVGNPHGQFGGVGDSGMGAYHGYRGYVGFSHQKYVLKKPFAFDLTLRYPPYGDKRINLFRKILK